jgi:hypothetical protein
VLVRTGGRWGGGDGRSWLLIKHRDDWAGELDITEFAPKSVKSDGDFEDILAADQPDVWESHRPAAGGEAGAMLKKIIERAQKKGSGLSALGSRHAPSPEPKAQSRPKAQSPKPKAKSPKSRAKSRPKATSKAGVKKR